MMNFKMVTSCPQNVDTIVRYTKYDAVPTFSDPAIQEAFDAALGGDDFGLEPGTVKSFRMKLGDRFVNLILVGFNCKLYEKAGAINESEQEEIVNNGRGKAFVITAPSSRTAVEIVASKDVEELFTV